MRRILRRVRNTGYIVAAAATASYAGFEQGRVSAAREFRSPDLQERMRAYLRARAIFTRVIQYAFRCDRETAETSVDSLFPVDAAAPSDLH